MGSALQFNVPGFGVGLETLKETQYKDAQAIADSVDLGTLELAAVDPGGPGETQLTLYYFHPDHLGSSTFISDISGYAYQLFLNLPFGETMAEQRRSSFNNVYKFNGKELDPETGLYYYGARYYNPRISNWLSVDPIALWQPVQESEHYILGQHNGGYFNPKNMSVYGYCYQSPINYIDPNGKQSRVNGRTSILFTDDDFYGDIRPSTGAEWDENMIAGFMKDVYYSAASMGGVDAVDNGIEHLQDGTPIIQLDAADIIVSGIGLVASKAKPIGWIARSFNWIGKQLKPNQVRTVAKELNIYSGQKSLSKDAKNIIDGYLQEMKDGIFNYGAAGFIDNKGKYILTDGNHKMNAAIKYSIENGGDKKYIDMLINKGNFTPNVDLKNYNISKYKFPTE